MIILTQFSIYVLLKETIDRAASIPDSRKTWNNTKDSTYEKNRHREREYGTILNISHAWVGTLVFDHSVSSGRQKICLSTKNKDSTMHNISFAGSAVPMSVSYD